MSENPNNEKISTGDSLVVQCLRILEQKGQENESRSSNTRPENILIPDVEYDSAGRLASPLGFLVRRAEILLPKYHLRSVTIRNSFIVFILTGIVLILLFGLSVIPLAKSNLILGTSTTNLAGPFFFFVVLQVFFLTLSVFFLLLTGIFHFFRICFKGKKAKENISDQSGWFSATSGMILLYFVRMIIQYRRKWNEQKHLRQKSSNVQDENARRIARDLERCQREYDQSDYDKTVHEISTAQETVSDLFSFIAKRRTPFFCLSGFYSHLLWLVVSVSLLFCLLMNMQKTIYHYRWESSITSIEEVRLAIRKLDFLYPENLRPSEEEIRSLFNMSVDKDIPENVVRRTWSLFILWTILITCVLPRGIMTVLFLVKFCRSLKCYEPDLNTPYFQKIIENAEESIGKIQTEEVSPEGTAPENDANGTLPLPIALNFNKKASSSQGADIAMTEDASANMRSSDHKLTRGKSSDNDLAERSSGEINSKANSLQINGSKLSEESKDFPISNTLTSCNPVIDDQKADDGHNNSGPVRSNIRPEADSSTLQTVLTDPSPSLSVLHSELELKNGIPATNTSSRRADKEAVPNRTIAFGYDTAMLDEEWRKVLTEEPLDLFGNIAADRKLKKAFRELIERKAPTIKNLIVLQDCSVSPVRQQILFFGEIFQLVSSARITILLSCGDRLRRLFNRDLSKITQRLDDWRNALEDLRVHLDLTLEISTSFDHQKATVESWTKLRRYLSGQSEQENISDSRLNKAFALIQKEANNVFESEVLSADPDQDLTRITALYESIEKIYQEESHRLWEQSKQLLNSTGRLFSKNGSVQTGESGQFSENVMLEDSALEKLQGFLPTSISLDDLKNKVLPSAALMNKARTFCSRLSGKGALTLGALGAALPLAAAVAPLVSAPLTIAGLATAAAGLGGLLPTSLAAGGVGAALGAVTPVSLAALRDKIKSNFDSFFRRKEENVTLDHFQNDKKTRLVETLVETGALWTIIFELQGEPEEVITEKLTVILEPLKNFDFSTSENVDHILNEIRKKRLEQVFPQ